MGMGWMIYMLVAVPIRTGLSYCSSLMASSYNSNCPKLLLIKTAALRIWACCSLMPMEMATLTCGVPMAAMNILPTAVVTETVFISMMERETSGWIPLLCLQTIPAKAALKLPIMMEMVTLTSLLVDVVCREIILCRLTLLSTATIHKMA